MVTWLNSLVREAPALQPVDFTTLIALSGELQQDWIPARLEQVYQRDRHTLALALRTMNQRGWLDISWHPQAARICLADPPPRTPDTFTFSEQLRHQLNGLALTAIAPLAPWERVLDLQFARRPGDAALWHLYVEVMGKYSNVVLTTGDRQIVTLAHQVSAQQSSVRPLLTGQAYEIPPILTEAVPRLDEPQERWQERVGLIPGPIRRNLLKTYRGLSSVLVQGMLHASQIDPDQSSDRLTPQDWNRLFDSWQTWLHRFEQGHFQPARLPDGYTVMGWGGIEPTQSVHALVHRYYVDQLNQQEFVQLRHQIQQKLSTLLKKLYAKAQNFMTRLDQSEQAEHYREQADLLMAYLHEWQPGMTTITLSDFLTSEPTAISLDPEKNAVQNAQAYYKKHQKLKRSRLALEPLLAEVQTEINYLEQVEVALNPGDRYSTPDDLTSLKEIRDELIQQGYLNDPDHRFRQSPSSSTTNFHHYTTPGGFEVLIGRNNRQNDLLTFRQAGDYDLWFHAQEIPGSHVLLRLPAGSAPDDADLQFTADLAAHYSRARQSEQVPVIYTEPKNVYKPKGAKPGIAIYKQERVLWGHPQRVRAG